MSRERINTGFDALKLAAEALQLNLEEAEWLRIKALHAHDQEESLERVIGIAGMLEFQAKLALDQGETDIKLDAKVIVPKIVESLRALKERK